MAPIRNVENQLEEGVNFAEDNERKIPYAEHREARSKLYQTSDTLWW